MSCEKLSCLYLPTNKISLMQWMLLKLLISLASTLCDSVTGTSRALVQLLVRVYMRAWIGSPTTLLTRLDPYLGVILRTGNSGCRGEYYLVFFWFFETIEFVVKLFLPEMVFSFVGPVMVIFVIEEEWFCQMYTFELLIEFGYSVLSCNWISIDMPSIWIGCLLVFASFWFTHIFMAHWVGKIVSHLGSILKFRRCSSYKYVTCDHWPVDIESSLCAHSRTMNE